MIEVSQGPDGSRFLDAVRQHRVRFEEAARRAEEERTLPADVVELMHELRLFWLKTPAELGGSELDPLQFCDVLEEIAYYDASAAWTAMVGNGTTGRSPAGCPTRECVRSSPALVRTCRSVQASSVPAAPRSPSAVATRSPAGGVSAAGSTVPRERTIDLRKSALRGGDLFKQTPLLFVSNELSPVVVGIARRAVDDMYELAAATARRVRGAALSERASFQKEIGRAECELRSVQLLYRDAVKQTWAGTDSSEAFVTGVRAQHTLVAEVCTDLVGRIFRYGGGRVLGLDHRMQRHLRNLMGAMQHVYISDENYEWAGRAKLTALAEPHSGK